MPVVLQVPPGKQDGKKAGERQFQYVALAVLVMRSEGKVSKQRREATKCLNIKQRL